MSTLRTLTCILVVAEMKSKRDFRTPALLGRNCLYSIENESLGTETVTCMYTFYHWSM